MSGIVAVGGAIAITVQVLQWINQLVAAGTDAVTAWEAVQRVINEGRAPSDAEWALAVGDMDQAHQAVQAAAAAPDAAPAPLPIAPQGAPAPAQAPPQATGAAAPPPATQAPSPAPDAPPHPGLVPPQFRLNESRLGQAAPAPRVHGENGQVG